MLCKSAVEQFSPVPRIFRWQRLLATQWKWLPKESLCFCLKDSNLSPLLLWFCSGEDGPSCRLGELLHPSCMMPVLTCIAEASLHMGQVSKLCKWHMQMLKDSPLCLILSDSAKDVQYLVLWVLSKNFMKKQDMSEIEDDHIFVHGFQKILFLPWAEVATSKNCLKLRFIRSFLLVFQ